VFHLSGGRLKAVDCINRPKDFMLGKKLIHDRAVIKPSLLADETQDLDQNHSEVTPS
jgi:3-phenylpropionate/trans-cinnamate dioxygenase ferredoxin reductase subunit